MEKTNKDKRNTPAGMLAASDDREQSTAEPLFSAAIGSSTWPIQRLKGMNRTTSDCCSPSDRTLLATELGQRTETPDQFSAPGSMSASPDTDHSQDLRHTASCSVSGVDPVRCDGVFLHSAPMAGCLFYRNRDGQVWPIPHSSETHEETAAGRKMPGKPEKEKGFDNCLQQPPELKFTAGKCHAGNTPEGQGAHILCKTLDREGVLSEDDLNEHARDHFINSVLFNYLTLRVTKIQPTFADRFCQFLKEHSVDLNWIINVRDSGVCMEPLGKILDWCFQSVVMAMDTSDNSGINFGNKKEYIYDDTVDGESQNDHIKRRQVAQSTHSSQQTSVTRPLNSWEQTVTTFLKWIKQEPLGHGEPDSEKHSNQPGTDLTATKDVAPDVTTDSGMSDQSSSSSEEDHQNASKKQRTADTSPIDTYTPEKPHTASWPSTEALNSTPKTATNVNKATDQAGASPSQETTHVQNRKLEEVEVVDLPAEPCDSSREAVPEDYSPDIADELLQEQLGLDVKVSKEEDNVQMTQDGVTISLQKSYIWRAFAEVGTEMIINRNGRRMFPYVSVRLWGLEDLDMYEVEMEVVPADSRRYKFIQSSWTAVGVADNPIFNRPYPHPESPNSGKHWMRREIHFPRIKLTNNRESCEGNMLLHSMHKYVVQITVRQMQNIYTSKALRSHTFRLDLTSFIAVTAYQNDLVTKLKIHNNPFAKAFRDSNLPMSMKRGMATKRHYSYRGDIPLTDMDRLAMPPGKKRELQESGHRDSSVLLPETLPGMSPFYQTITQTGQSSMPLPPPSSSMMWMPHGIPPPWMANLGRGLIHPCFYSLPRPSGLGPPQHVLSSNPVVSSWDRRSPAELY